MSFATPARLLLIIAPFALLVAYIVAQRRRQKYALRFTSVDLLASVAPRRSGWERHISASLMLLALVFLVLGFAHPTRTVKVPNERGTIILTVDTSARWRPPMWRRAGSQPRRRLPSISSMGCRRASRSGCCPSTAA